MATRWESAPERPLGLSADEGETRAVGQEPLGRLTRVLDVPRAPFPWPTPSEWRGLASFVLACAATAYLILARGWDLLGWGLVGGAVVFWVVSWLISAIAKKPSFVLAGAASAFVLFALGWSPVAGGAVFGIVGGLTSAIAAERAKRRDAIQEAPVPVTAPLHRRQAIPERVRHEVWRRDLGCCVDCGSREWLEFDHTIPVSKGGSNTTRNIELRCESCNRSKGARI